MCSYAVTVTIASIKYVIVKYITKAQIKQNTNISHATQVRLNISIIISESIAIKKPNIHRKQ